MYTSYLSRLKEGKTNFLVPVLIGSAQESFTSGISSRQTRSKRLKEVDTSEDETSNYSDSEKRESSVSNSNAEANSIISTNKNKRLRPFTNHIYSHITPITIDEDNDFELRVPISVEVLSGQVILRDQIEWDLSLNPLDWQLTKVANSLIKHNNLDCTIPNGLLNHLELTKTPEFFSKKLCSELGIGGEFVPLVANNIREQILKFQKERLEILSKHTPKKPLTASISSSQNNLLSRSNEPTDTESDSDFGTVDPKLNELAKWHSSTLFKQLPITNAYRDDSEIDEWGPSLEALNSEEIDKILLTQERNRRRLRRSERGQAKAFTFLPSIDRFGNKASNPYLEYKRSHNTYFP
ncbi:SWI/SNF-related matrix-associated actin-dependent regulator of chromatin subfamily B member 1 [Smittium culicis]|uniref:SWI/SNF-related matrix-associated actin-dependent regulator of chromatin subfamily B member 1 n=1 Tax=Smittium culicis TaxID=133412 RepID=A0A1R1YU05_9FUNG|nr:SWI/SNF-related matrix-associated actin-dependent regulator of chromatin subfamily B member 1 [Smittium culicis]